MATTTNLTTLKINYLNQAQYDDALANNLINSDELYLTPFNISVNGASIDAASFFAPATSGATNQILVSGGAGNAPIWLATASGAAYATATNGTLTFGTLPVPQGGTGATSFTANSIIMSGSTTTSALTTRAITNNTSNTAITNSNTNIPTMNTIYYGLVTVNNASQTRATGIYAPTSAGTSGQYLKSSGGTSAPTWATFSASTVGLGNVANVAQVTAVSWDSTNKKITRTIGGTAADVVQFTAGENITLTGASGILTIASTNTDTLVKQTSKTDNVAYKLLMTTSASPTSGHAYESSYATTLSYNPSTKILTNETITLTSASSTTANTAAYDVLNLGNSTNVTSTSAHSEGKINLYSAATKSHIIVGKSTTTDYTHTLPNKTGIIATLDGSPSENVGSTTQPVYVTNEGVVTAANTFAGGTAVTLNGVSKAASTASFYAPISAGDEGYILMSGGTGGPSWNGNIRFEDGSILIGQDLHFVTESSDYFSLIFESYSFSLYYTYTNLNLTTSVPLISISAIDNSYSFNTLIPAEIKAGLGLGTQYMNVTLNGSTVAHQLGTLGWNVDNTADSLDETRVTFVFKDDGIGMWSDQTSNWLYNLSIPVSIENGGTGATTAAGARTNLGITPANINAFGPNSLGTITNANNTNLYGSGFYQGNAISNLPTATSGSYYMLICFGTVQLAVQHGSSGPTKIFARHYTNSQWYAWKGVSLS